MATIKHLGRSAWSAVCEAGPSRQPHRAIPITSSLRSFASSPQRPAEDKPDPIGEAKVAIEGATDTISKPSDPSTASPAQVQTRTEPSADDSRDPYSLTEDFLRGVAEENAADDRLADVVGSYEYDDGDGGQSKRFLDALTAAVPQADGDGSLRPPPLRYRSTADHVPVSVVTDPSIKSRLSTTWNQSKPLASPPPRIPKGIHNKNKRLQGMTPSESESIAELLRQKISPSYSPFGSIGDVSYSAYDSSRHYGYGARDNAFGSYGYGAYDSGGYTSKAIRARRRLTERPDDPNREMIEERLSELKEDAMSGQTDVDLLEWAKRRVFVQEKLPDGSEGFHPVYPHALAFLLDTLRRRFQSPHLVLAVFAYAQNLSPESYISGCLAPAYNEVLWTKWESFRDIEGVEQSIKEMEANGVRWDKGTYQVINELAVVVSKDVYERGLANRWGKRVYEILANLDRKTAMDVDQQEHIYELQKKEKARRRQERTMLEYQNRRGGAWSGEEDRWSARY